MITCFSRESFCNRGIVFCARLVKDNFVQMQLFNSTRLYLSLVVHLRCVFLCSTLTRGNKALQISFFESSDLRTWAISELESRICNNCSLENLTDFNFWDLLPASGFSLRAIIEIWEWIPSMSKTRSSLPAAVSLFWANSQSKIAVWSRWRRAVTRSSETIEGAKGTPELHSDDTKQKHFLSVFPEQKQQKVTVKGSFLSIEIHEQNTECNWGGKRNSAKCIQVNNYKTQSKNTVWSRRVVPEHWNSWAKHNECSLTRSSETIEGGKRDSSRTAFRWTTKQKQNNQCIGWFGVTVFSVGITLSYLSKFIWFPSLFYNRTILNWNKVQSRDYPFKNTAPTFSDS